MPGRRLLRGLAFALAALPASAAAAYAADAGTFARQIAARYHVDARHVVTADIDYDGDLDVLAATDRGFMVWVNDGAGRFTSKAPKPRPLVDGHPADKEWSDAVSYDSETIQNDAPFGKASANLCSQLPGLSDCRSRRVDEAAVVGDPIRDCSIPRAPPTQS
jgi:hypothetical protein